jgi:hypothetical protein
MMASPASRSGTRRGGWERRMNRPNELIGTTLGSAAGDEEARRVHLSGLATRLRGGAVGPLKWLGRSFGCVASAPHMRDGSVFVAVAAFQVRQTRREMIAARCQSFGSALTAVTQAEPALRRARLWISKMGSNETSGARFDFTRCRWSRYRLRLGVDNVQAAVSVHAWSSPWTGKRHPARCNIRCGRTAGFCRAGRL